MNARDRIEALVGEFLKVHDVRDMGSASVELHPSVQTMVETDQGSVEVLRQELIALCIQAVGEASLALSDERKRRRP